MALRLVFFGTPEFALPSLRLLLTRSELQIEAVVTQPDRPRGRGQQVASSPVKDFALQSAIYVYQPENVRDETALSFFKRMQPDAVVIIAYGQKIPQSLLDVPRLGWINLHGSLLPKYRGAAPINWAIVNGEKRTGVTTMLVEAGMDTGPILMQKEIEIGADETAPELAKRMSELGAPLIVETLIGLSRGEIAPRAQDSALATKAPMLKKEMGRVNWKLPAEEIYNRIRGFEPWPGAYTTFRGQACRIWGNPRGGAHSQTELRAIARDKAGQIVATGGNVFVSCGGDSWLRLTEVQLEGKKKVAAADFANGARLMADDTFGL
jgi:methionyl-tRNA formyltransferase